MPGGGRKSHFPADQERMELPQCHLFGLTWGISFLGRAEVLLDLLLLLKNESVRKKKSSEAAEPRGKCEYFLASSQQTGAWICRMRKDLGKTLSPKGAGRENAKFLGGFRL